MTLSRSIPALSVQSVAEAVEFYTSRLGFTCLHQDDDGFAILNRDAVELHLWAANDDRWKSRSTSLADGYPVRSGAESFKWR